MANGEPGSPAVAPWAPNPRAVLSEGFARWMRFINEFREISQPGYFVEHRGCYARACMGEELAVIQWKAWELFLAREVLLGAVIKQRHKSEKPDGQN